MVKNKKVIEYVSTSSSEDLNGGLPLWVSVLSGRSCCATEFSNVSAVNWSFKRQGLSVSLKDRMVITIIVVRMVIVLINVL
jgi:NADH:ubiquinone oxidoreductase subunit B-like Fe-S oxidoreductase